MSDLDALMVAFQTQLSDVMEAVVKTAMYEVTRLVEDGFLQEMKRRNQEVESLSIQLQWAERKLSDQEGNDGGKTGKCVDCAKEDMEPSVCGDAARLTDQQGDILRGCGVKKEADSEERWPRSQQGAVPEAPLVADDPTASHSPESQAAEEDVLAAVDLKEERGTNPSCFSAHLGGWSGLLDGKAGAESHGTTETIGAQPKQTQENSEELLRNTKKQDRQTSTAYVFPEDQEDTHMATDSSVDMDSSWAGQTVTTSGLLQNHRVATEKDPAQTSGSLQQTEQEPASTVTADANARNQISTSELPAAISQNTDALGVTIKQEVIIDCDGCVEIKSKGKKLKKTSIAPSPVKQHRMNLGSLKQNHVSNEAAVQEVMKMHSKVGTGVRLQAAIQHLQQPMKRPPHMLSTSTTAALSAAQSLAVDLNRLNRISSTSKAAPAVSFSVQQAHLSDKPAHNRTGNPWVSIKTQLHSAKSHHTNPLPHPDSGPRHLLRCVHCGKCFPHPSNLKAHLQTHTGERPFCCSLCGRSFTKLSNLKAHRRVHTGERPYCCLACGKCFTQKCNLKRHQRIHLDE